LSQINPNLSEKKGDFMMEDKTLENKFARHLSGVISGMCYEQGKSILDAFCENRVVFEIFHSLAEKRKDGSGYILCETMFQVTDAIESKNIFKQYGISAFYYQMWIKPTADELIEFLDSYDEDYEGLSEEEILDKVVEEVNELTEERDFDAIKNYFENIKDVWLIEDEEEVCYGDGRSSNDNMD